MEIRGRTSAEAVVDSPWPSQVCFSDSQSLSNCLVVDAITIRFVKLDLKVD